MKKSVCQILFVAINIFILTFNLSAQSPETSIKFRLVRGFMIIVPVQINDSETLEFLLDTGTNTSVIIPEVAARLNLRPVDRVEIITAMGSVAAPRSFLSRLALGTKSATNMEVLWSVLPEPRRLDKRISGILGQNFLAQFNFTLDYGERRITFTEMDTSQFGQAVRIPLAIDEQRILLNLKTKRTTLKFVLDSGAEGLILFASGCRKLESQIKPDEQMMQVSTYTGKGQSQTGWLDKLQFGEKSFADCPSSCLAESSEPKTDYCRCICFAPSILIIMTDMCF